jgi:hypothetical protein
MFGLDCPGKDLSSPQPVLRLFMRWIVAKACKTRLVQEALDISEQLNDGCDIICAMTRISFRERRFLHGQR